MKKIENYKAKFPLLHAIRGVAATHVVLLLWQFTIPEKFLCVI